MMLPDTLRCEICDAELHIAEGRLLCPICKYEPPAEIDESLFISPQEIKEKLDQRLNQDIQLIDVRTKEEYDIAHISGFKLMPLNELPARYLELDKQKETIVHCHHGIRSCHAATFLLQKGFKNLRSMKDGIDGWSLEIDSSVRRY